MKGIQRDDDGFPLGIKQCLTVGSIVYEKLFVLIPGAEMTAENGKDPVFWFNLRTKNSTQLRKADKAPKLFRFTS